VNVVALLGVDNGDDLAPQKSQGHESLFGIAETVIFIRVRDALEHLLGINTVEAVFLEVHAPFPRIPSDHWAIVYTTRIFVKENALRGLTFKLSRAG
jgi:hypothetical protein